jgi:CubicO group peptidase (beta-lactamase class C family)
MKIDADAAGFDARRLERLDTHLARNYVDPGKIAGCQVGVVRHGQLAHLSSLGSMDLERGAPVAEDAIWRLYSMTKPITGVALLTLYEQGFFQLSDPVHRFIPEWRGLKVGERGDDGTTQRVDPVRPPTVRDVLMHMSGIGYTTTNDDLGDVATRGPERPETLEDLCAALGEAPLRFHPGTRWLYSYGTDVAARLVEVISGERFDHYLHRVVLGPLGMVDTGFVVDDADVGRFAANYRRDEHKRLVLHDDPMTSDYRRPRSFLSGGGGLVGTTIDYLRFCRMLLGGGELDGVRVLAPRTVELMTANHLPGGADMAAFALPGSYGEVGMDGMGFGLTVAVSNGPVATQAAGPAGEFMWGGAASTTFWVAPADDLAVVFMTQLMPSSTFNFRGQLKALVYGAMTD